MSVPIWAHSPKYEYSIFMWLFDGRQFSKYWFTCSGCFGLSLSFSSYWFFRFKKVKHGFSFDNPSLESLFCSPKWKRRIVATTCRRSAWRLMLSACSLIWGKQTVSEWRSLLFKRSLTGELWMNAVLRLGR